MSDVMLFGVLGMPYEMAMGNEFSRRQFYDRVQEALARLKAAPQGWEPIEAAPKTGQNILLGFAGSHSGEGFWMGDPEQNYWRETGWFECTDNVLCEHPSKPTHWMPLIEPPPVAQPLNTDTASGSPSSYRARPSDPDLNPVSVKDLSASASPATKEQQ